LGERIVFYLLGFISLASALCVVTVKNIFRAALFLVLFFFSVAGLYLLLEAEFLAAVQVLIYVGAVTVLIIFAIMLTYKISDRTIRQTSGQREISILTSLILLALLSIAFFKKLWPSAPSLRPENSILLIGKALMKEYLFPFELVSLLLLISIIGAIILARKETE